MRSHLCGVLSKTDMVEKIILLSEYGIAFVNAKQNLARPTRDSSSDQNKSSAVFHRSASKTNPQHTMRARQLHPRSANL